MVIRCELRDPSGGIVSDIAWNPDQGLHIVTASGDDRNPVIKLWDLRSSTSLPLATLQGHTEGVLSVSWCPNDSSLLLSCGKDNRTILWDLFHLQPAYELPVRDVEHSTYQSEQNVFGSLASSASHRRYHVSWSPCLPAVVSAASFDRKVQFFSMSGAPSRSGRAPKWLRRPVGATFGFGGKLVNIVNNPAPAATASATKKTTTGSKLQIFQVEENPEVVAASDNFHDFISKGQYKEFCEYKSQQSSDPEARKVWSLMNVICFGANAREELLTYLGFDSKTIVEAASKYLISRNGEVTEIKTTESAEELFGNTSPSFPTKIRSSIDIASDPNLKGKVDEMVDLVMSWEEAEPTIRRAVVVGNFGLAVDCCLAAGMLAEALLLAQCGDHELRARTQAAFFERQRNKHPFLNVLHAVIKNQLMSFVLSSDLQNWRETLALLSTYGKSEEFSQLCEALATRLENELGDKHSAALCFMCAANVSRTIAFWTEELQAASNRLGQLDVNALQDYVEKIMVFTHANPTDNLGVECGTFFAKYGEILVNQGRLSAASSYLKGSSIAESVLMDRIYHAGNKPAGSRPPPFPFTKVVVEQSKTAAAAASTAAAQALPNVATTKPTANAVRQKPGVADASSAIQQATAALSITPANASVAPVNPLTAAAAAAPAAPTPAAPALPAGWLQLFDPSSNRPYYVNQATGQSQWDPPSLPSVPAPAPTPSAVPQYPGFVPNPVSSYDSVSPAAKAAPAAPEVVPTISQLPLAETSRPVVSSSSASTSEPSAVSTAPVEVDSIIALGQMIEAIAASSLNPTEKKQVAAIRTSYTALCDKLKANQLDESILQKLALFMDNVVNKNYPAATSIQADLVTTSWNDHKDWIKGLKTLLELAKKK
eukprot:scaffold681_cov173-Ochromonas_danica.AAC.55